MLAKELKFLLAAGVPLLSALSIVERQIPSRNMKLSLSRIKAAVSSGTSLSDSFKQESDLYPEIFVNIIAAGEAGGVLEVSLSKIASYYETKDDLKKKIVSATIYPLLVTFLSLASIIFISVYLIPTMNGIFLGLGIELPPLTRAIGSAGDLILNYWHVIMILTFALIFGSGRFLKRRFGDDLFERVLLNAPLLGGIFHKMICSRVSSALSTLIGGGVPLISSLRVASAVSNNSVYRRALTGVIRDVEGGEVLSEAFKRAGVFPESFCELVSLGEATGRLEDIFADLEGYYERDVESRLKVLTSLVEPLSTVLVGFAVGAIVFSIFLPLMSIVDALAK